jgi:hypothetical protein
MPGRVIVSVLRLEQAYLPTRIGFVHGTFRTRRETLRLPRVDSSVRFSRFCLLNCKRARNRPVGDKLNLTYVIW